jgi:hypothetical protein
MNKQSVGWWVGGMGGRLRRGIIQRRGVKEDVGAGGC